MKKYILAAALALVASSAFAACPGGSSCTQYNGTVPYAATGGTNLRTPATRATDKGISIQEFTGADPTGAVASTAQVQAAIDYAFTHDNAGNVVAAGRGMNTVTCPAGAKYKIEWPIFFDPPGNMRGNAAAWSGATTYALNDVVSYNGIPWISLAGSNTNHTPATGLGTATWWTPTTFPVTEFSFAATLKCADGLSPIGNQGSALQFITTYNNAPGLWSAPGNGVEIHANVVAPAVAGGPGHRCGLPSTGIGISIPGGGGGANRTKLVSPGSTNMYSGITTGVNHSSLGAENKIDDPVVQNSCKGITFPALQNYINYIKGGTVCGNTGLWMHDTSGGAVVQGGNWSCGPGDGPNPSTSFAMSSVSVSNPSALDYVITATLTLGGDAYMVNTCTTITDCERNVYNAWTVNTTHFGVIPFQLETFNSGTGVATFRSLPTWQKYSSGVAIGDLATELGAITTIYATEYVTVFDGAGIDATGIHIENFSNYNAAVATRLIKSTYSYGGARTNTLTGIYNNAEQSSLFYLSTAPTAAQLAIFYAQQTFDFITVDNVDTVINSYTASQATLADYMTATVGALTRFTWHNSYIDAIPLNTRPLNYFIANGYTFSGNQYQYAGTPAFGFGFFDIPPRSQGSQADPSNVYRQAGWQQTPAWGNRPAPYSSPCIAPSQYAQLQAVPAITKTGPSSAPVFVSGIYTSGTGKVSLTITGGAQNLGKNVTISGATGTGSFASINGTRRGYGSTTTLEFYIGTGLTMTITGATIAYNDYTYSVPYPMVFGGQQYRQCPWDFRLNAYAGGTTYAQGDLVTSGGTTYYSLVGSNVGHTPASSPTFWGVFHYGFVSNHIGWSLGQDMTTTNVPGLTWASRGGSYQVYISDSSGYVPDLLIPGQVITLTGTGGAGCPATPATFVITGIHRYLGYVDVVNAAVDYGPSSTGGAAFAPWGTGNQCTGTTVAQPVYAFTSLN